MSRSKSARFSAPTGWALIGKIIRLSITSRGGHFVGAGAEVAVRKAALLAGNPKRTMVNGLLISAEEGSKGRSVWAVGFFFPTRNGRA